MDLIGKEREKWIALLRGVKFFDGFEIEDLDELLYAGKVKHYGFHDYIFKEGDRGHSFFVILKGNVKLIKFDSSNHKNELTSLTSGDCFGEMGLLMKKNRTASILATEDCYIYKSNEADIEAIPDSTKAKLYHRFATFLAERLKTATEKAVHMYY